MPHNHFLKKILAFFICFLLTARTFGLDVPAAGRDAAQAETPVIRVSQHFTVTGHVQEDIERTFRYLLTPENPANPMPGGTQEGVYAFTMTGNDALHEIPVAVGTETAENGVLTFSHAGDYRYHLKQDVAYRTAPYTLDETVFILRIYVRNTADGVRIEAITAENANTHDKTNVAFENKYTSPIGLCLTATKAWEDPLGIGSDITSVQILLQRTTTPEAEDSWTNVRAETLLLGEGSTVVFDQLQPEDDRGRAYTYRAVESAIFLKDGRSIPAGDITTLADGSVTRRLGGFEMRSVTLDPDVKAPEGGYQTTLMNAPVAGTIRVVKEWEDRDNVSLLRPEDIHFSLYKDGEDMGAAYERTLEKQPSVSGEDPEQENANEVVWTGLPVMHTDGTLIDYSIKEEKVLGYDAESSVSGGAFAASDTVDVAGASTASLARRLLSSLTGNRSTDDIGLDGRVTFRNTQTSTNLLFEKKASYDEKNHTIHLGGATFAIYEDPSCSPETAVVDEDGKAVTVQSDDTGNVALPYVLAPNQTYYLKELSSGRENVSISTEIYRAAFDGVFFKGLETLDGKKVENNCIVNDVYRGEITLVKTDKNEKDKAGMKVPVENSTYGLFRRKALIRCLVDGTPVKNDTDLTPDGTEVGSMERYVLTGEDLEGFSLSDYNAILQVSKEYEDQILAEAYAAGGEGASLENLKDFSFSDALLDAMLDRFTTLRGFQFDKPAFANLMLLLTVDDYELIESHVTDADGVIQFTNLIANQEYIVRELVAPDGYAVSEKPVSVAFSVNARGEVTTNVSTSDGAHTARFDPESGELTWYEPQTAVQIRKTNRKGKRLSGAVLTILDADKKPARDVHDREIGELTTGEDLDLEVAGLRDGTYYVHEVSAPEGYQVAGDISFVIENRLLTVVNGEAVSPGVMLISMVDPPADEPPTPTPVPPTPSPTVTPAPPTPTVTPAPPTPTATPAPPTPTPTPALPTATPRPTATKPPGESTNRVRQVGTGDNSPIAFYVICMALSAGMAAYVVWRRNRKR